MYFFVLYLSYKIITKMKKQNTNQIAKELIVCFTIASIVSYFIVEFIVSNKPIFNW